jgi:hypothetical protein|tara:strand:+ start:159 stop:347 length:189 start_codon:yes stop_codon:yes gene_type:complete
MNMPKGISNKVFEVLRDLSHLDDTVADKRYGQRSAHKNSRNLHCEKQLSKRAIARKLVTDRP